VLGEALGRGVTFIDTASVNGDGRSDQLFAKAVRSRSGKHPMIAMKIGKRPNPHVAAGLAGASPTDGHTRIGAGPSGPIHQRRRFVRLKT
jgi:aryl-alcohol dehydrogenase-like predicted oxidoreductase